MNINTEKLALSIIENDAKLRRGTQEAGLKLSKEIAQFCLNYLRQDHPNMDATLKILSLSIDDLLTSYIHFKNKGSSFYTQDFKKNLEEKQLASLKSILNGRVARFYQLETVDASTPSYQHPNLLFAFEQSSRLIQAQVAGNLLDKYDAKLELEYINTIFSIPQRQNTVVLSCISSLIEAPLSKTLTNAELKNILSERLKLQEDIENLLWTSPDNEKDKAILEQADFVLNEQNKITEKDDNDDYINGYFDGLTTSDTKNNTNYNNSYKDKYNVYANNQIIQKMVQIEKDREFLKKIKKENLSKLFSTPKFK